MDIKERIKKTRALAGLTQREFGEAIGISGPSITKIESGENNPSEQTVRLISTTFKINYHWLKTGKGPMKAEIESDLDLILEVMGSENDFAKKAFRSLARIDAAGWEVIRQLVEDMMSED